MCVAAGLPAIIGLLSTGVSVAGTFVGAAAQKQAADYNAAVDTNNAVIAQRNAEDARQRGIVAEQDVQLRTRALRAKQINILSERNLDVGSGTPLDIIGDTAAIGKLDALTTRANFEREAIAHQTQRMNFQASAETSRMAGRNAMFSGLISGVGTALGGASNYMKLSKGTVSL
jgi:hypothetical protein